MTAPRWLIVALILTTATQLRVAGLPVGPGEVMLLLWILHAGLRSVTQAGEPDDTLPLIRPLAWFWLVNWVLLIVGLYFGYRRGILGVSKSMHDVPALVLMTAFSMVVARQAEMCRSTRPMKLAVAGVMVTALGIVAAAYLAPGQEQPVVFWLGTRLRGWAENPNQMAQLVIPVPFLALFLVARARSSREQFAWLLAGAVAVGFGILIKADAITVAWVVAAGCAGPVYIWRWARRAGATRSAALFYRFAVPTVLVILLVVVAVALRDPALRELQAISSRGGQGAVRLVLWMNGINAIGESPWVGFGPGAHSGLLGPFEGKETHNTIIDWGTSTGLPGMTLFLLLILGLFRQVWRCGSAAVFAAFVALFIFMQLHYSMRQPLFWFWALMLAGTAGRPVRRGRAAE